MARRREASITISELFDNTDKCVNKQEYIEKMGVNFYSHLYNKDLARGEWPWIDWMKKVNGQHMSSTLNPMKKKLKKMFGELGLISLQAWMASMHISIKVVR